MLLVKTRSTNQLEYLDFVINYFKNRGGGGRKGLDRYPYLKHIIELCTGDWVGQL